MLTQKLRRQFLEFFKNRGHAVIASSSVVPHEDPTLLFANAGMNQFKELFLGRGAREYKRAATCQKCIRAGGKHNDLENVGHTTRHLTFFEMLGNFSFGDYFKEEAIRQAWELSTKVFQLDPERIWPTVFREDEEAFALWTKYVPAHRITRMDEADNFWSMGETGPCGPCSELYYDRGDSYGEGLTPASDPAGLRFIEFWNLVFMQYNCREDKVLEPLPRPCVDTGAGLERVVALKLGVESLFQTDILRELIAQLEEVSQVSYEKASPKVKPAFCVIADHIRSLAFAIADGAQPSNVERGYVLRKILRRAVRYGRLLGLEKPFMADLLPHLVALMGVDYPELATGERRIAEILTLEEEAFLRTLQRGGNMLQQVIQRSYATALGEISGEDAFILKDTYGLPFEEIMLIAKDSGLKVDREKFMLLEGEARARSRKQHKEYQQQAGVNVYESFAEKVSTTLFTGYHELTSSSVIVGIARGDAFVESLDCGEEGLLILDRTPFYAEMGGQVGDTGFIATIESSFNVIHCFSPYKGLIAHGGVVTRGSLRVGDSVTAEVAKEQRSHIAANHTATHLLHWALQKVVGEHIKQAGSVVDGAHLRFDFTHHKALTKEEITAIEDMVNEKIRANLPVRWYEMPYDEAQQRRDIKQFFGDKYGVTVRVIDMDFSKELCGGTHAAHTGDLGSFAITKEGSIAAGVRRLEAVTGKGAEEHHRAAHHLLDALTEAFKVPADKLLERIEKDKEESRGLAQQLKRLQHQRRSDLVEKYLATAEKVGDAHLIAAEVALDAEELKLFAEELIAKMTAGAVVVAAKAHDRCAVILRLTDDMVGRGLQAGTLAKGIGAELQGNGGGKNTSAQAGGKALEKLGSALEQARMHIIQTLGG